MTEFKLDFQAEQILEMAAENNLSIKFDFCDWTMPIVILTDSEGKIIYKFIRGNIREFLDCLMQAPDFEIEMNLRSDPLPELPIPDYWKNHDFENIWGQAKLKSKAC